MRLSLLLAGTALLLCQSAAMAETNTHPTKDTTAESSANATTAAPSSPSSQMRDSLQKAGFSNIRMEPSSFVISATDKDGHPVVMTVTPDSFTEVTEESHKGSKSARSGSEDSAAASSDAEFVAVANTDELSSTLTGLDIYNSAKQDIGQIKDIAVGQRGRTRAYIVSVGGFLEWASITSPSIRQPSRFLTAKPTRNGTPRWTRPPISSRQHRSSNTAVVGPAAARNGFA